MYTPSDDPGRPRGRPGVFRVIRDDPGELRFITVTAPPPGWVCQFVTGDPVLLPPGDDCPAPHVRHAGEAPPA